MARMAWSASASPWRGMNGAIRTIEVQVVGTAVEGPGPAPRQPWLTDLSGQEWWALNRAGYEPVTLVWGHCTWFVLTTDNDEYIMKNYSNQEFQHWGTALGQARRVALDHARQQATQHGATGIAGVRIERRLDEVRLTGPDHDEVYKREHHNIVVSMIGTAIHMRADAPRVFRGRRRSSRSVMGVSPPSS